MSHYHATAIHPETGKPTPALFIDGHFGGHRYGVKFEGEDKVWRAEDLQPLGPEHENEAPPATGD